jgi:hypothetical protein
MKHLRHTFVSGKIMKIYPLNVSKLANLIRGTAHKSNPLNSLECEIERLPGKSLQHSFNFECEVGDEGVCEGLGSVLPSHRPSLMVRVLYINY